MIKRLIALISLLLAATSCCKDNLSSQEESPMRLQKGESITRTKENALNIALKAQEEFFGATTRSKTGNNAIKTDQILVKTRPSTRAACSLDTLYYIVNFTGDSGFAIVAANKNEEPLIAITEKGSFSGDYTGVYGFDLYMEETENRLAESAATTPQQGPDEMVTIICDTVSIIREEMPAMINISWHQEAPFNWECPTIFGIATLAGCPAIAVAQAMAYYQYPKELQLTYIGHPVDQVTLSWSNMINHTEPHSNCQYCYQNAYLIREIGEKLNIHYGIELSGIYSLETIKENISLFGYTCDEYVPYEIDKVLQSLKNNHPVIVVGYSEGNGGHMWNIFGYKSYYRHINYYTKNGTFRPREAGYSISEIKYLYMNYGSRDLYNGYYISYHREIDSGIKVYDGGTTDKVLVSIFDDGVAHLNKNIVILTNFKPIEQ